MKEIKAGGAHICMKTCAAGYAPIISVTFSFQLMIKLMAPYN